MACWCRGMIRQIAKLICLQDTKRITAYPGLFKPHVLGDITRHLLLVPDYHHRRISIAELADPYIKLLLSKISTPGTLLLILLHRHTEISEMGHIVVFAHLPAASSGIKDEVSIEVNAGEPSSRELTYSS